MFALEKSGHFLFVLSSMRKFCYERIGERVYKKSLFVRLLILMLLATTVPFILSNVISYRLTSESIQASRIQLNQNSMTIGMENIEKYLNELNRLSLNWYYDADLMEYLMQ